LKIVEFAPISQGPYPFQINDAWIQANKPQKLSVLLWNPATSEWENKTLATYIYRAQESYGTQFPTAMGSDARFNGAWTYVVDLSAEEVQGDTVKMRLVAS